MKNTILKIFIPIIVCIVIIISIYICLHMYSDNNNDSVAIKNIGSENQNVVTSTEDEINNTIVVVLDSKEPEIEVTPSKELEFELPINGATGYAMKQIDLKENLSDESNVINTISVGQAFTIISEKENYLYIKYKKEYGWVDSTVCMINLPDIIPSIIYDNTNSYSSIYESSGYSLPGITGKKLYDAKSYNKRLQKDEFDMPIIYSMAKKIYQAQKLALENNQSLKIYETFRPYETQQKVSKTLKKLMNSNEEVKNGINVGKWNEGWFIAQSRSNHQYGVAMDVSLVDINSFEEAKIGEYSYIKITNYTECKMPTKMHELSATAVTFTTPVSARTNRNAWKNATMASTMTKDAKQLQSYCTEAGLTPLASEWWHFDDWEAKDTLKDMGINGEYYLQDNVSVLPE